MVQFAILLFPFSFFYKETHFVCLLKWKKVNQQEMRNEGLYIVRSLYVRVLGTVLTDDDNQNER